MKKSVDITISIASYNTKEYLNRCVSSIYKYAKGVTFEIIVVDNSSSDGTQKMVERTFPQVQLIKNKRNNYYGGANNQALQVARGEFFLILNADTYFVDNSIKKIVSYMKQNRKVGAAEGLEIYEDNRLVPNGSRFSTPLVDFYELSFIGKHFKNQKRIDRYRYKGKNRRETFPVDVGCDAFLVVQTKLLRDIEGYDETMLLYYTENDLCLRIKKAGYSVVHFGPAFVYHKVSVSANKLKWKKLDLYYHDMRRYYTKNGYMFSGNVLYALLKCEKLLLQIFRPTMFDY